MAQAALCVHDLLSPTTFTASPSMQHLRACHAELTRQGVTPGSALFPEQAATFATHYFNSPDSVTKLQSALTRQIEDRAWSHIITSTDSVTQARLRSASAKHAGAWLLAIPSSADLTMRDSDYIINSRIQLGLSPLDRLPSVCACGQTLAPYPLHLHDCVRARSRAVKFRHDRVVLTIAKLCRSVSIPVHRENHDFQRTHNLRPDLECILATGNLHTDISFINPCAASHRAAAARRQFAAATSREKHKIRHYRTTIEAEGSEFLPMVMETFGAISKESLKFLQSLVRASMDHPGPSLSLASLIQHIAVQAVRGNAHIIRQGAVNARTTTQYNSSRFIRSSQPAP
jgi:hypothetical protein